MAFPQSTLPITVWIAPGANPGGDPGEWSWTEITSDVRVSNGVVIENGRGDEAATVDPGTCSLSLNNRSGNYSPRNPLGTWYGQLSKNTPLQIRLTGGSDTFTRSVGSGLGTSTSGSTYTGQSGWVVNGSAAVLTITGANVLSRQTMDGAGSTDYDIVFTCWAPVAATGASLIFGGLQYIDASNYMLFRVDFGITAGVMSGRIQRNTTSGGFVTLGTTDPLSITYSAGERIRIRCQRDGAVVRMKVWEEAGSEPATWTVEATEELLPPASLGIFGWRLTGNTNTSPEFHFDDLTITNILFTGTVSEWPVRWDRSGNDCVTTVQASGILRRLQQGRAALRSPLYRQLSRYTPAGYWPLEDGSDSTTASSAVTGGAAAAVNDVTFAADDTLPGAETTMKMNSLSSRVAGRVLTSTGTGFAALFLMKLDAPAGAKTAFIEWVSSGTVRSWRISGDNVGMYVDGYDNGADLIVGGGGATIYVVDPTAWVAYQLEAVQNGGNVDWTLLWHQVGTQTFWFINGSVAGTVGKITSFNIFGATALIDAAYGHVYAGADTLPFVDTNFSLVSNGYSGELAADRVQRLCDEEGVLALVEDGDSQPMGRQRVEVFLDLLQTIEEADLGVLYERGTSLAYKPSGARFNVITTAALDFDLGHIAEPPEPTDDDQRVRNDITASRDSGGQVRYTDDVHIALNGRYDEGVTVNVATDAQLSDHAGWRLHMGTWDEMRWPRISLNLARNPTLIESWLKIKVGSRITVAHPPDQVLGDDIDVLVEGYSQTLTPYGWTAQLNCSPARPWDVGIYNDTGSRYENVGSTLNSSATTSATSISVASPANLWTTNGGSFPFDVNVGGERVTVTNITGASSPQTFTVTRSVNGVVKAHSAGAEVHLWSPVYYAF